MTTISPNLVLPDLAQATTPVASTPAPAASAGTTDSADTHGPAYIVSVSPSGEAVTGTAPAGAPAAPGPVIYSAQSSNSSTSQDSSASGTKSGVPAGGAHGGGGGGGGISYSQVSDTAEIEKHKVIPLVGVTGADEVVDSKGNVDHNELNKLIAADAAKYHSNGN